MSKELMKIEIVFDGTNVMMRGPLQDKILCLGMMELAKAIIINGPKEPAVNKPISPVMDLKVQ